MARVLIGLPMEDSVKAEFFKSFFGAVNLLPDEGNFMLHILKWRNIVKARNDMAKTLLEGDFTHLFFMDSDMEFPENTLSRLLSHNVDVVGGLYTVKMPPYHTTCCVSNGTTNWESYWPKAGDGLIECNAVATGCMLVKREVFEKLDWPYFWYAESENDGEDMMTEDVYFCIKAKEAGFKIHCDTTVWCGHVGGGKVNLENHGDEVKVRIQMV